MTPALLPFRPLDADRRPRHGRAGVTASTGAAGRPAGNEAGWAGCAGAADGGQPA